MKEESINNRIVSLLNDSSSGAISSSELFYGTLSLITLLYGRNSIQVETYLKEAEIIRSKWTGGSEGKFIINLAYGMLKALEAEINLGLIGSLERTLTGEVLTDFLQLARTAFSETGDDAKNVSAVLAASLFEDTIRRIAGVNGISHKERLQDVIIELKEAKILQGSQVGIANSYLNFRNSALHAQWDKLERESVASVLSFVEQLLLKHFS